MNYAEIRKHQADFEVHYRFFTHEQGGRVSGPPWQHYRCDWAYADDDIAQTGIYMIHPEFVAEDGSIQPEGVPVPWSGTATMWILSPEMRGEIHRARIQLGVRGYFMEGSHRVAESVVTRILGLQTNPNEHPKKVA